MLLFDLAIVALLAFGTPGGRNRATRRGRRLLARGARALGDRPRRAPTSTRPRWRCRASTWSRPSSCSRPSSPARGGGRPRGPPCWRRGPRSRRSRWRCSRRSRATSRTRGGRRSPRLVPLALSVAVVRRVRRRVRVGDRLPRRALAPGRVGGGDAAGARLHRRRLRRRPVRVGQLQLRRAGVRGRPRGHRRRAGLPLRAGPGRRVARPRDLPPPALGRAARHDRDPLAGALAAVPVLAAAAVGRGLRPRGGELGAGRGLRRHPADAPVLRARRSSTSTRSSSGGSRGGTRCCSSTWRWWCGRCSGRAWRPRPGSPPAPSLGLYGEARRRVRPDRDGWWSGCLRRATGSASRAATTRRSSSPAGAASATTIDTIVEGVHFTLPGFPLEAVGRKALAAALSDLAAMGAEPGRGLRLARRARVAGRGRAAARRRRDGRGRRARRGHRRGRRRHPGARADPHRRVRGLRAPRRRARHAGRGRSRATFSR